MMTNLINNLGEELILAVVGAVFGALCTYIGFMGKRIIQMIQHHKHIKKMKTTDFLFDENLNIFTLENAVPKYKRVEIEASDKKFFISFPEEKKHLLSREIKFHDGNCSFDGSSSFQDLSSQTGIYDLEPLINQKREIVAEDLIHKRNGCMFNEVKYGVYDVIIGERVGDDEEPIAKIITFETDFFTFRVMNLVFQDLKQRNHDIARVSSMADFRKYNCFSCAIGLHTIIGIDSERFGQEDLIISKRSNNTIDYHNKYHISVSEGMCLQDYNPSTGRVQLHNCLYRGIEEELGILREDYMEYNAEFAYWDILLNRDTYDFEISCYIRFKKLYFRDVQAKMGKDKTFEVSRFETVPANKKAIEEFIEEHDFMPQGLYILNSFAIRRFGSAIRVPKKKKN